MTANDQPLIKNSNIHIECHRSAPKISEKQGVGIIKYEFATIAVKTSGPALPVSFNEVVEDYRVTPPGSILAFNTEECPVGWSDYKPAYGRFIRGIDKSGKKIDPDGLRALESIQGDMFKSHTHRQRAPRQYGADGGTDARAKHDGSATTGATGGTETRPKNVALLYCQKS